MNLEEHIIKSSSGEYTRKLWLLQTGKGAPERIGVFLDGEYYVNQMDAPALLVDLHSSGVIPSMICVFVSHVDGQARHHDLICNSSYAEFIAVDLMRWLRLRDPGIPESSHFIAGPSLGGLAAAYLALAYPQVFSQCLSQSGSFWWENERLTDQLDAMPASRCKFWLSVGDKETQSGLSHAPSGMRQEVAQLPACERFAEALNKRGHEVHFNLFEGGHNTVPWKEELPEALQWLLEGKGVAGRV